MCSAVLEKFYIGDVEPAASRTAALQDELAEGTFYFTLKQRVHAHFKEHKVSTCSEQCCRPHVSTANAGAQGDAWGTEMSV